MQVQSSTRTMQQRSQGAPALSSAVARLPGFRGSFGVATLLASFRRMGRKGFPDEFPRSWYPKNLLHTLDQREPLSVKAVPARSLSLSSFVPALARRLDRDYKGIRSSGLPELALP